MKLEELCNHINQRREALIKSPNAIDAYLLSFDAHYILVTIHPWVDGNGRMSRLIMNHLQFEFGLVPAKIIKEDKAQYIEALNESREEEAMAPFQKFMLKEHTQNLRNEIFEYRKSMEEDIAIADIKAMKSCRKCSQSICARLINKLTNNQSPLSLKCYSFKHKSTLSSKKCMI